MKTKLIILYGPVSSGKSSLAKVLQEYFHFGGFDCVILSSDEIRTELTGSPAGKSKAVWQEMKERLEKLTQVISNDNPYIILDATAMSPTYQKIVNDYRGNESFVIQLYCTYDTFKQREDYRDDRYKLVNGNQFQSFIMPDRAYFDSSKIDLNADLKIDTSCITKEDVFKIVIDSLHSKDCETKKCPQL